MIAFWYSKNLELRSEILEATGSPFLPWKVSTNLTTPKWRCVYLCFCHGIANSQLGRARVMKFSFLNVGILNWSNLEVRTYSFIVEGWEEPIIFFYGFCEWRLRFVGCKIQILPNFRGKNPNFEMSGCKFQTPWNFRG